jgi:hypothetical protein
MVVPKLRFQDRYQGYIFKAKECMEDLRIRDLARLPRADLETEILPATLQDSTRMISTCSS